MAAVTRERNERPYEDGGGYGKFSKRPFRRSTQTTPYDRPAKAIRNPSGSGNGWLSKLVDPAQRLIASGAQRLFATVFRKRLPAPPVVAPPSQPPETEWGTEENRGVMDKRKGAFSTDLFETHRATTNGCSGPSDGSDMDGVTELEVILKQKTFTRSEIDRLTALLQSKTVDFPTGNEEKKSEVIASKVMVSQGKKELLTTPVNNGFDGRFNSTPIVSSSVLEEDFGSPTELAKSYMRSRPLKVSPSMLESQSQALRENPTVLTNHTFTPKSPMISIAPRSSGHAEFPQNGFVTPRSRGRFAIYSMTRTPYSRVHATTGLQGTRTASDAFAGPSSSFQNAWENNGFSGSKQGASKRSSSVLDNDMGSVGPIRRIRQKSNLLPMSGTLSIRGNGMVSNAAQRLTSTEKPVLAGEPLKDNGNSNVHGTAFTPVPSKSSEMASKILQQLDVLVSSREKSPARLSPSMLRGQALRSLEDVDSSKLLEIVNDNNKLDAKPNTLLPDARESVFKMKDKIEENGPSKSILPYDKSASALNGMGATSSMKNNVAGVKTTAFPVTSTIVQSPQQKKRAFQMSAHEDFLELDDDDDYPNWTVSGMLAEGREKIGSELVERKTIGAEAIVLEKSPALSEVKSPSTSTLNQKNAGIDGSVIAEKSISFTSLATPLPAMTDKQAVVNQKLASISDEGAQPNYSNASPQIFSSREKVALPKEPNGTSQTFHFSNKTGDKVAPFAFSSPVLSDPSVPKLGLSSDAKPEGFSFKSVATGATELVTRDPGLDKTEDKSSLKDEGSFRAPENVPSTSTSTSSTGGLFSFGIASNGSSLNNGSLASTPSSYSSPSPPLLSSNFTGQNSSSVFANSVASGSINAITTAVTMANFDGNSNFSISASAPSLTATPISKIGSVPSTSASTVPSTIDETTEAKTKEPGFGNPASGVGSVFGGTCSGITSTGGKTPAATSKGNSFFGGTFPAVTSSGSSVLNAISSAFTSTGSGPFSLNAGSSTSAATNQSQGFNPFSASSAQVSAAGTGMGTATQTMPMQFSSPASTPFALTGSTAFSSGSPTFGSSSTSKLFSSGASFGLTSSTTSSESISVSSIASPASTVFGSNWQAPKSMGFSTSSSSSTPFAFGATSNAVTSSSASVGFAPSVSSGPAFPFSSPASTTPSQPVFGNPNPGFRSGSSPSGNNDQMSMEDSMAEDTVQATTPSVPAFFQQPAAAPGPLFDFSTLPGGNQFTLTGSSGANPFQFESQPSVAAPQNPAFQASGSREFNAGGSFSFGAGGGDKSGRKFVRVKKTQRKR
ncbi:PREDICTED: nuclear pore complex protein NUP1-like isoform X2 [Populus euphratica]|uniref:Nuclear pore complex protein NUP1-like isoform X2 n=1 Tax=Populus euphratica TaxID=75702 RepID=A0AAJ6U7S3_POPEU|nr:PREDICTED: nuclear pore complex protein NUP1-like isoform X2 [Populus euphratica]